MANKEHLAKLKEGVEAWNQWREENYEIEPDLSGADLFSFNLESVNFHNAKVHSVNFQFANLKNANLEYADLFASNLRMTQLNSANLTGADLRSVQALSANFEDATLTGACIGDWNVNSLTKLQNVKCKYIYMRANHSFKEQKWIFDKRIPHDLDKIFAPGEFTKRYQKILETVDLYFGEGIDWQVFLNSFQKLQEEERIKIVNGEREIPIVQGIENTGDGSFIIKIGVSPDTDEEEIEKSFWQKYQPMLEAQEEKYRLLLSAKDEQINDFRQQNANLNEIVKLLANKPNNIQNNIEIRNLQGDNNMTGDQNVQGNYYQTSGNVGIVHNEGNVSGNAKVAGVINEAAQQDLAQAAAEIQQLLDQLSKTYPTKTFAEKGAVADQTIEEIKNNPTLLKKVINVIKAMGIEALAEAVDNPIFNIAKTGIEAALIES